MGMINNIDYAKLTSFESEVTYQKGQVVSKTITKNKLANITLFAFDKDEGLSPHVDTGDALVTVLDGKTKITIDNVEYTLNKGESILMPANIVHSVYALEPFKMLLIVVFEG